VVVAIFRSLEGESLEDFSIRLAERWRIGQKGLDNGVILLVFLEDRKLRMEVGYGLEGRLPDGVAGGIIRDQIAPSFRERRYADGIDAGLTAIFKAIAGEYQAPPRRDDQATSPAVILGALVLVAIIAFMVVQASRRSRGRGRRGYTAGPGVWSPTGFGAGYGAGRLGRSGGGGGGFGGGGFSGGGGGFGGGGASGDW
jgi:uncharacterized protein